MDKQRPNFTESDAVRIARDLFGLEVSVKEFPSYRDRNYHLQTNSGEEYMLKIAATSEPKESLELQNAAITHIGDKDIKLICPAFVETVNGEQIAYVDDSEGTPHMVRLLTFVPGAVFAEVNPHSPDIIYDLGSALGTLSQALEDFSNPVADRDFIWDMKNASSIIRQYKHAVEDVKRADLIEYYLKMFEEDVVPQFDSLRTSVIHNDANDYNVLVSNSPFPDRREFGLIDYGDIIKSHTVFEIAIAAAYIVLDKPDPIAAAAHLLGGYHEKFPLTEIELDLLFCLICTRLATSVCLSTHQSKEEPDNEYIAITEGPAWKTLEKLRDIHPRYATYVFRHACGLQPCPSTAKVVEWLENTDEIVSILEKDLRSERSVVLDLSVGSLDVGGLENLFDIPGLSYQVSQRIKREGAYTAIGRYNEARLIYTGEQFETDEEMQTIHIGIDLYFEAGTPIYAPLDGKIHSFKNNELPQDYGPTIILEHEPEDGLRFYTLYGHMSLDSIDGLNKGDTVKKGQEIARVGDMSVNGGWPPHIHFEIIIDMFDKEGDFPGVAPPSQREVWLSICPDPNLILRIPESQFPKPELTKEEIIERRKERIGPSLSISYKKHLKIVRGFMQYLYDETGRTYLDAVNNVPHVGHSHPDVVRALHSQAGVLNTNTRYLHDNLVEYAARLTSKLPEPLRVCFFVNSGSEANELALRLARAHTDQQDLIVIEGAYHGNTDTLVDISSYKHDGPGGKGAPPHVHKVVMPDIYRGPYRRDDAKAGEKYAKDVQRAIRGVEQEGRGVAAFIFEPLLGCGGQIVLPDNYLKEAFQFIRNAGGMCIADEVQVGFGRVGTHFWGFETQGIIPDIVTLGKPIGNGHPMAAVITTTEIAASFNKGMEFFSTTGGNPVSCAVGMAVLDVIESEDLQASALRVGSHLKSGLEKLKEKHQIIGDVRGLGLFIGVELVLDRESLTPAADEATYVIERMRDQGILISTDGPFHNVLKIKPPMVFTEENADFLVQTLDKILSEDFVTYAVQVKEPREE